MSDASAARILALETTSDRGTVALLEGPQRVVQLELPLGQRSAQSLVPTLDRLFAQTGWTPDTLQLIAVAAGPGSFTGLRVGVTTAKTLAYAHQLPIASISTLDAIAANVTQPSARLACVLNAQRQQLYAAWYTTAADQPPSRISDIELVDITAWLQQLDDQTTVCGPVLAQLTERLPPFVNASPPEHWVPQAEVVGRLGYDALRQGRLTDAWSLVPQYHRPSAAEEKRATG